MSGMQKIRELRDKNWEMYYQQDMLSADKRREIISTLVGYNESKESDSKIDMLLDSLNFNDKEQQSLKDQIETQVRKKYVMPTLNAKALEKDIRTVKLAFVLEEYRNWMQHFLYDSSTTLADIRYELQILASVLSEHPRFKEAGISAVLKDNPDHPIVVIYQDLQIRENAELKSIVNELRSNKNVSGQQIAQVLAILYRTILRDESASTIFNMYKENMGEISKMISALVDIKQYKEAIIAREIPTSTIPIKSMNFGESFYSEVVQRAIIGYYTVSAFMTSEQRNNFCLLYDKTVPGLLGEINIIPALKQVNSEIEQYVTAQIEKLQIEVLAPGKPIATALQSLIDHIASFNDSVSQLNSTDNRLAVVDCAVNVAIIPRLLSEIDEAFRINSNGENRLRTVIKKDEKLMASINELPKMGGAPAIIRQQLVALYKLLDLPIETPSKKSQPSL